MRDGKTPDKTSGHQSKPGDQMRPGMRFGGRGGSHAWMTMPQIKPRDVKGTMKRLWEFVGRRKLVLGFAFILVLLSSAFHLIGPLLIGKAIDNFIIPGDFRGLARISMLMLAIYAMAALCTWLQNYLMVGIAQKTVKELRKELFYKVQAMPLGFFDSRQHGDLMSRLTNDIENISASLNMSIIQIFSSVITFLGTLVMMLYLSPVLTLFTLVIIPVMLLTTGKIATHTREFFADQQKTLGKLNGFVEEIISGQKVVKVFCREEECIKEFEEYNQELRNQAVRAQIFSGVIPPLMNALNNIGFVIVAAAGGYLTMKGIITVGVIASFINYSKQFARPLNELANQFNMFQAALAGAERAFEIMDEKEEPEDVPGALVLNNVKGAVKFDSVYFGYKKDMPVLKNVSFDVKPGQTIALVGPTGSGKTTIVNLLMRFYDIDEGEISIDGKNIYEIRRDSVRSALGIVLQDTYLFSESIRENIRYGRLDASDEEVEKASRLANAHYFVCRLPQGYDTVITEGGANLSQGERQMIAIARAVLADPAILILDEATSNVDTRTELHIQEAMLALMKGRTSFVIAHRLSTIRNADLILVINNGEIIENGNHEELLKKKGLYYNLYTSQFRREIQEIPSTAMRGQSLIY